MRDRHSDLVNAILECPSLRGCGFLLNGQSARGKEEGRERGREREGEREGRERGREEGRGGRREVRDKEGFSPYLSSAYIQWLVCTDFNYTQVIIHTHMPE